MRKYFFRLVTYRKRRDDKSNPNIQILNEPKTKEKKLTEQEVLLYDVSAAANLKHCLITNDKIY